MTRSAQSPVGPTLTLCFQFAPAFALVRTEYDPGSACSPSQRRVLSSEDGHEAQGAQRLKWPKGKGQAQFKSMVLALVRLTRLQQEGKLPANGGCLLAGPYPPADEPAKNPAKILGTFLSAKADRSQWAKEFCGLDANGKPNRASFGATWRL